MGDELIHVDAHALSNDDRDLAGCPDVDICDATTREERRQLTKQIALWMIHTDYNRNSGFVRNCDFTGGEDPHSWLKNVLKADIGARALAHLKSTVSRPFRMPNTGRVTVKVINDCRDDAMKPSRCRDGH